MSKPLSGIRVLEFEGLAPTVHTGMVLADYGADVVIINKAPTSGGGLTLDPDTSILNRGKRSITLDLKIETHKQICLGLYKKADIVIDTFRPGVLERLGLGPKEALALNKGIIFSRITGFGQTGPCSKLAGHDINYLAQAGILATFGKEGQDISFPGNILADFCGGGSYGVIGILLALAERTRTGKGQVVDVSLQETVSYLSQFVLSAKKAGQWNEPRGSNLLDSGSQFYRCYQTKCGGYMSVGSIEPKFYYNLCRGLGYQGEQLKTMAKTQHKRDQWPQFQKDFEAIFKTKTLKEWTPLFIELDCCVMPVLDMKEMRDHKNVERGIVKFNEGYDYDYEFAPAPLLSNHLDLKDKIGKRPERGEHQDQVYKDYEISANLVKEYKAKL